MIGTKTMETPARMGPCGIEESIPEALTDLVLDVQDRASRLGRDLHPASAAELREMTRGLNDPAEYKDRMRMAYTPRQGDRDGRGNLSLSRLTGTPPGSSPSCGTRSSSPNLREAPSFRASRRFGELSFNPRAGRPRGTSRPGNSRCGARSALGSPS